MWSHHLCHSFLVPFPCSGMGFLLQNAALRELLQRGPFQQGSVLQQLLQSGSFLPNESFRSGLLQCEFPMGHNSCEKTFSCVVLSLCRLQLPPGLINLLQCESFMAASLCSSVCCRETACVTTVFTAGCRRISVPAPGVPLPPASSPILTSAGLFLSPFLPLLSPHCCTAFLTLSLKCCHRGTVSTSDGLSSGQWQMYLRTVCV